MSKFPLADESQHKFILLKDFHQYKKGEVFDCYGGLVRGIGSGKESINFDDKEWFKYKKNE